MLTITSFQFFLEMAGVWLTKKQKKKAASNSKVKGRAKVERAVMLNGD
jgi:hypothetical protein